MRSLTRFGTFAVYGVLVALMSVPLASADDPTAPWVITGDYTMEADYTGQILVSYEQEGATLDCAGHTIHAPSIPPEPKAGIIAESQNGTVKNCAVEGFDYGTPEVEDGYGFLVANHGVHFENNTATDNWIGFLALGDIDGLAFVHNRAVNNTFRGFMLEQGISETVVAGNVVVGGDQGIAIVLSDEIVVDANIVNRSKVGIYVENVENASKLELTRNQVHNPSVVGFEVKDSSGITLTGNSVRGGLNGIVDSSEGKNIYEGNFCTGQKEAKSEPIDLCS